MPTAQVYPAGTAGRGAVEAAQGPPGAPLGLLWGSLTPPSDQGFSEVDGARKASRRSRHAIKAVQRKVSPARSSRLCWYGSGGLVVADVGAAGIAHVSGVYRCGSPWSCCICAPVIRRARAAEVDEALTGHLSAGGGAEFVSITVPHFLAAALAPRLMVIRQAMRHLLTGAPWRRRRDRLGYIGAIRAVDITYGNGIYGTTSSGWHPHLHAVLVFERPLTDDERADLAAWLKGRWAGVIQRKGFGRVHAIHGVDVRPVTQGGIGDYLTKVEGGWSAGAELARGDVKKAGGGVTPFQLLAELAATGDVGLVGLWREYEGATFGAHFLEWSAGLRARLLGAQPEKSDVDLAAAEGADLALVRAVFEAPWWAKQVRAGTVGLVLDDVERSAVLALAMTRLAGHVPRPLPQKGKVHEWSNGPPDRAGPPPLPGQVQLVRAHPSGG